MMVRMSRQRATGPLRMMLRSRLRKRALFPLMVMSQPSPQRETLQRRSLPHRPLGSIACSKEDPWRPQGMASPLWWP